MKKDLYEVVTQEYYQMTKEELRDIAKEALYKLYEVLSEEDYKKAINDIYKELE
jgi:hypothetical protein